MHAYWCWKFPWRWQPGHGLLLVHQLKFPRFSPFLLSLCSAAVSNYTILGQSKLLFYLFKVKDFPLCRRQPDCSSRNSWLFSCPLQSPLRLLTTLFRSVWFWRASLWLQSRVFRTTRWKCLSVFTLSSTFVWSYFCLILFMEGTRQR